MTNLPNGFYLLSSPDAPDVMLVKVISDDILGGGQFFASGLWDGEMLAPLQALKEDCKLIPAVISVGEAPSDDLNSLLMESH